MVQVELCDIEVHENVWIAMRDGERLAARIWRPKCRRPVPALLTYSPYFARLFSRGAENSRFPYYAARGYACVRVDIRGTGNSDGRPMDEYALQEQLDGVDVVGWISAQPWCSGAVGMEGISWSGINALQIAAERPDALKAIITHCSTDDLYEDDAHYKGGCVLHDMVVWATLFMAFEGQAPDPEIVGAERWRERWIERLHAVDFNLGAWLEHQSRDSFWRRRSVSEDLSKIECPVYAIGGWVDGYKNAVFRLLRNLRVPRKGLIGPWTHLYPHKGVPGPSIDYLAEAVRWWDHWLKGIDTGIMEEPMLTVWMQGLSAAPTEAIVPGRWISESVWPALQRADRTYFLNSGGLLGTSSQVEEEISLRPVQTVGGAGGIWWPGMSASGDLHTEVPLEQTADDCNSLVFDSAPLMHNVEILGAPFVTLSIKVDKPVAYVAVRLNEVLADGPSRRITYGIKNLCHGASDVAINPVQLRVAEGYEITIALDHLPHCVHAGCPV